MALGNGLRLGFEQREDAPLVQRDANASWSEQEPALKNAAAAAHQEQAAAAAAAGAAKAEQHNGWSSCWRRPAEAFWANGVACALGSSLCFALAGAFVKALDNRVPVFEVRASECLRHRFGCWLHFPRPLLCMHGVAGRGLARQRRTE